MEGGKEMETRPYSWIALDPECEHPGNDYHPSYPKKNYVTTILATVVGKGKMALSILT